MLDGRISISRPNRSSGVETINIEITDETSRTRFLEVEIDMADFARALTGLSYVPIKFDLVRSDLVGTLKENKTEVIVVPRSLCYNSDDKIDYVRKMFLEPYEKEGWYARDGLESFSNSHNYLSDKETAKRGIVIGPNEKAVEVVFFRNVRVDGTPVERA